MVILSMEREKPEMSTQAILVPTNIKVVADQFVSNEHMSRNSFMFNYLPGLPEPIFGLNSTNIMNIFKIFGQFII